MAKKFFYVCAGLLLLAFSYHVGAQSARAQSLGSAPGSIWEGNATIVVGGAIYAVQLNQQTGMQGSIASLPLPRSGDIAAVSASADGLTPAGMNVVWLLYSDGALFEYTAGRGWTQPGNLIAGIPTETVRQSWGQVKSTYRK